MIAANGEAVSIAASHQYGQLWPCSLQSRGQRQCTPVHSVKTVYAGIGGNS